MIENIQNYPYTQELLVNKNWRITNYIELCSGNEYWSNAYLVSIEKQIAAIPNDAIIYLLQRLISEQEGWNDDEWNAADFIRFMFDQGYIASGKGIACPIDSFWVHFDEIINGISTAENFKAFQNGLINTNPIPIKKEDILSVTCFADEWKSKKYFIETKTDWLFFDWGTTI